MSEAGSLELINAAGDSILLGSDSEAYSSIEAETVREAGDYYLVADFYGDPGDWSVTIEQPSA